MSDGAKPLAAPFLQFAPMALTPNSIAAAAKKKAEDAQSRVREAEDNLHSANERLKCERPNVKEAAQRTAAAEAQVKQAADKLEVVKVLLDAQLFPARPSTGSSSSGDGSKSLLRHLKRA